MLQTQKLLDSVIFARNKGYEQQLTAAELEMMNLTGDGNGFDMVTIPLEMRGQIPTANFFLKGSVALAGARPRTAAAISRPALNLRRFAH